MRRQNAGELLLIGDVANTELGHELPCGSAVGIQAPPAAAA
jgi:hypothetical protein